MKAFNVLTIVFFLLIGNIVFAQEDKVRTNRFNTIDADGNEVITIREMKNYYENKKSKEGEPIDPKKLFYALDANENSIITLNEYIKGEDWKLAYKYVDRWQFKVSEEEKEALSETKNEKAKTKFQKIDTNRNDTLSIDEVVSFYKGVVNNKTGKLINGKLNFYTHDVNNDGSITLEEFYEKPNWKLGHERLKASERKDNGISDEQPSEGYVKKRIQLFQVVDTNDDFMVSLKELKEYYKDKLNNKGKPVNAQFKFFGLDKNEDNLIELAEFASKIDLDLARKKYKALNGN